MKKNGFTLIELLVVIAIAGIIVATLFGQVGCARTDTDAANKAAGEYVHRFPDATGFECANVDSDGNGYVSCTVFRKDGQDPLAIECGSERWCIWNCARGCKYVPFAGSKVRQ